MLCCWGNNVHTRISLAFEKDRYTHFYCITFPSDLAMFFQGHQIAFRFCKLISLQTCKPLAKEAFLILGIWQIVNDGGLDLTYRPYIVELTETWAVDSPTSASEISISTITSGKHQHMIYHHWPQLVIWIVVHFKLECSLTCFKGYEIRWRVFFWPFLWWPRMLIKYST